MAGAHGVGIGHNRGPSMEAGHGFRKVAWTHARAALLPTLPLEVVRLRVKRAERLGLPYRAYATIRAVSGRDIVGFLFSENALDLRGAVPVPVSVSVSVPVVVAERLDALRGAAARLGAVYPPRDPEAVAMALGLEAAGRAPGLFTPWREIRDGLRGLVRGAGLPREGVVVVAATALERAWVDAAGLAGSVPREAIFDEARQIGPGARNG